MKKFWKFILTIIIAVAAYGYEAYDFGSEAHEAISLLQGQLEVKLLDVGHGDAILLRNQAVAILVDTGDYKNSDILVRRLKTLGVRKLDALIITHHHLKFLAPASKNGFPEKDLNNNSLVFKLQYGEFSMLFTGDIEAKTENDLVSRYGKKLQSTVLKVAHHGSSTSSTYNFLKAVQPQLALISCGDKEKYNHPNKKVLGTFEYLQIPVKVTSQNGEITLRTDGEKYQIMTDK